MAAAGLAGCSSDALDADTGTLSQGETVSSQTYVNDSATAAARLRDFTAVLDGLPSPVDPADVEDVSDELRGHADDFCTAADRLQKQVVEDANVEAQRTLIAVRLAPLCADMGAIADLAAEGRARRVAAVAVTYRANLRALRAVLE